jgi:AcrR family transcriptional regulator
MFSLEASTAGRPGIRRPRQQRGRRTLDALLNAAGELLEAGGEGSLTVRALCDRVGCSTGAFYKRFDGIDALLDAIFADLDVRMRRAAARRAEGWRDAPTAEAIADAVAFVVEGYQRHPGTLRALLRAGARRPEYHRRAAGLLAYISRLLGRRLEAARSGIVQRDPSRAADFALRQVFAVLDQKLLFGSENPARYRLSWVQLRRELERAAVAYLMRAK